MSNQLEQMDSAVQTSDSTSGSANLISEVNNDRSNGNIDTKPDQSSESKISSLFGSLTLFGDDSKDSTSSKASDSTTATASDTSSDSKVTAASDTPSQPSDSKPTGIITASNSSDQITTADKAAGAPSDTGASSDSDKGFFSSLVDRAKDVFSSSDAKSDVQAAPSDSATTSDAPANSMKGDSAKDVNTNNGDGTADVAKAPDAADVNAAALKKIQDDPQVKAEQKKLNDDIAKEEKGLDKNSDEYKRLESMRHNMDTLIQRGAAEHPPLEPAEIAKTFHSASHMIEAKDGPHTLAKADRMDVAQQAMMHAADPTTIDQGNHETCNVTTVENRLFTKNPSAAMDLIDQVSTTGKYTTPGDNGSPQRTVVVPPESLKRESQEEKNHATQDGDRSYASQIFQVTAVNLAHQNHDLVIKDDDGKVLKTYPAGTVEYRQGKPDESATPPNSGEVLIDKTTGQVIKDGNGKEIHAPNMSDDQIVDAYNAIASHKDNGFYICNKDNVDGEGKQVTQIGSEAELKAKIQEAARDGKLPIILGVYTTQEPFFSDSHGNSAGGSGEGHVVTIKGLDSNGNPIIENSWGKESKHAVDWHELYTATMTPGDAIKQLKTDVAQNVKDHAADPNKPVDYAKQLELLRMQHNNGELQGKDEAYREQLVWITKNAVKDANDHNGGHLDERTETELKLQYAVEYGKSKENFNKMKDQVFTAPMTGIADGTGWVGVDSNGHKVDLPSDYNTRQTAQAADALYDAGNQYIYYNKDDYNRMYSSLSNKNAAEIQQMDEQFKAKHGQSMEDYIKDRFKNHPEERDKALKILHRAQTGNDQAAA